jgi:flagellar biogenesis protein FliO
MLPAQVDPPVTVSAYGPDGLESAGSSLNHDIQQATASESHAPQSQVVQPAAMQSSLRMPDAATPISAMEPVREIPHGPEERAVGSMPKSEQSSLPNAYRLQPTDPEPGPNLSPLNVPLNAAPTTGGRSSSLERTTPTSALVTVGSSLAIVLGLFFFVAWALRKAAPRGSIVLPNEVFEILGKASLGSRQQVQLVRCGNKLVLLSITPGGTESLTEVTDPLEVDRLAGICRQAHPRSSTKAFQQVFQQFAPRSGSPGPIDDLENLKSRRQKSYRWESEHV